MNGPGNYRVRDNIIYTRAIEINAVRQCNLSCRGCSHSSPIADKKVYEPKTIRKDLSMISKFIKCETIRIVGGEPLLHPNFKEVLQAIRDSEISEKICLVTNGILLHTLDEETLDNIDKIEISLYPIQTNIINNIRKIAEKISNTGIAVRILEYTSFRESITQRNTTNANTIKTIYNTCQIAHFLRCITVDNGKIYRCPQSMILSEQLNDETDLIEIDNLTSINQLLEFLENNSPCKACAYCIGSIGKKFEHIQVTKDKWKDLLPHIPDDAIDYEYAKQLSENAQLSNSCMNRKKINKDY